MTTAAVILAAGKGSRFSGDTHKLLAVVHGKPLVRWAIDHAVDAGFDETIVIEGAVSLGDVVPDGVTLIENHDWVAGQARSLQVAVRYAEMVGHDTVVVGVGDQPMVPAACWQAVGAEEATPISVAVMDRQPVPPTRLSNDVWPLLPIDGDEGARALLRRRSELVTEVPCSGRALDVDTLSDLDKVQRQMHDFNKAQHQLRVDDTAQQQLRADETAQHQLGEEEE